MRRIQDTSEKVKTLTEKLFQNLRFALRTFFAYYYFIGLTGWLE